MGLDAGIMHCTHLTGRMRNAFMIAGASFLDLQTFQRSLAVAGP